MEYKYLEIRKKPTEDWFKVGKLMVDVGADVLRQLLSETAHTPFLNDLVYSWLEQVHEIQYTNYAFSLLLRFTKDIGKKDKTCREILKSIIIPWKFPRGHKLTWLEELRTLDKWERDIEEHKGPTQANVKEMLSSWHEQIQERLKTIRSMSKSFKLCTTDLLELCQQYRQKLIITTKKYYDDFLLSSSDKLLKWKSTKKRKHQNVITILKKDRETMQKTWKKESEECLKSFLQDIKYLLTSWSDTTKAPELKKLVDDFQTEISEMDDTKLQTNCDEWHEKLDCLFEGWLKEIDERDKAHRSCLFRKSPRKQLRCFPSIESLQVRDLLLSVRKKLRTQLPKEQHSKLYTSSGIPNLNECDITIISIALKNCLVYPPMEGWNDDPPDVDKSVGADILRLQSFRRYIVAYAEKEKIDPWKFHELWSDMKVVLCRLASGLGDEYMKEVSNKVDQINRLSFNKVKVTEFYRILEYCKNATFAELYGILGRRKIEELMESIETVKWIKSGIKKNIESSYSDSHSESSDSDSHSESSDGNSD